MMTEKTRPNWARKVREMILFSVLCTVYCGRGCVSLESEYGKELAQSLKENKERLCEFLLRTMGQRTGTRGVLRGPRGPKKGYLRILKDVEDTLRHWICSVVEALPQSIQGTPEN